MFNRKSMAWKPVFEGLSQDVNVRRFGFALGMSQVMGLNKRTIENPGVSFVRGGICGAFYSVGFDIIGSFCAPHLKIILNSVLLTSTAFYQIRNYRDPPDFFTNFTLEINPPMKTEK